jgi:hypothetical protein
MTNNAQQEHESPGMRLLIAAGAVAANVDELPPDVRSLIRNASEVLVMTPVIVSKLHLWTNDSDRERHEADERLNAIFGDLKKVAPDSHVHGELASDVPLAAFDDAVRTFGPDHILIALRSADHAAWQEEHLVDRVKGRFQIPITVVEIDRHGHIPA